MKTPREILLARHRDVEPKLDGIRRQMVAEMNNQDAKAQSWAANLVSLCLGGSNKLWRELIWPCRRIWTGLAAVWILILAVNFSQRDTSPAMAGRSSPTPGMIMALKDQQRIMAELLSDHPAPPEADRQKLFKPKPRTESGTVLTV